MWMMQGVIGVMTACKSAGLGDQIFCIAWCDVPSSWDWLASPLRHAFC